MRRLIALPNSFLTRLAMLSREGIAGSALEMQEALERFEDPIAGDRKGSQQGELGHIVGDLERALALDRVEPDPAGGTTSGAASLTSSSSVRMKGSDTRSSSGYNWPWRGSACSQASNRSTGCVLT